MSDFEQLIDHGYKHAHKKLRRHGCLLPTWFIVESDGSLLVRCTPWEGGNEKRATIAMMSIFMKANKARRYLMLFESWMVRPKTDAEAKALTESNVSLEYRDDREEAVVFIGEDAGGEFCMGMSELTRPGGRPHLGNMRRIRDPDVFITRFGSLLRTETMQ